jgi:uncharacterized protein YukJ
MFRNILIQGAQTEKYDVGDDGTLLLHFADSFVGIVKYFPSMPLFGDAHFVYYISKLKQNDREELSWQGKSCSEWITR